MLRSIKRWFGRKEPVPIEGSTINETLLNYLGDIDEIAKLKFNIPKTRTTLLETATVNLEDLSDYLIEASMFVSKGRPFPPRWHTRILQYETGTLQYFITESDVLIHPIDWIVQHRHHIVKLLEAFNKMDGADQDYYQRKCNFVIKDLISLIKASRECLR